MSRLRLALGSTLPVAAIAAAAQACGAFDASAPPPESTGADATADSAPDAAADGGDPCAWFEERFAAPSTANAPPPGWSLPGSNTYAPISGPPSGFEAPSAPGVLLVDLGADAGAKVRAEIARSIPFAYPSTVHLEYAMRFSALEMYAELGCNMYLIASEAPFTATRIQFQRPSGSMELEFDGDKFNAPSAGDPNATTIAPYALDTWYRVTTDVTVDANGVANATGTISPFGSSASPATTTLSNFALPPGVGTLRVSCGLNFGDDGPGRVALAIDDVVARYCPPKN